MLKLQSLQRVVPAENGEEPTVYHYKILTKILANHRKYILPEVTSEEQNSSIQNRTIFSNLFLVRDLIKYTKTTYLLQIDQEKAFDKLDRSFLFKQWKN